MMSRTKSAVQSGAGPWAESSAGNPTAFAAVSASFELALDEMAGVGSAGGGSAGGGVGWLEALAASCPAPPPPPPAAAAAAAAQADGGASVPTTGDPAPAPSVWLVARAMVDQAWAKQPHKAYPDLPPQTHVVNARTNPAWRMESAGHRVVGRRFWHSAPLVFVQQQSHLVHGRAMHSARAPLSMADASASLVQSDSRRQRTPSLGLTLGMLATGCGVMAYRTLRAHKQSKDTL
jgi:hypothetical protein